MRPTNLQSEYISQGKKICENKKICEKQKSFPKIVPGSIPDGRLWRISAAHKHMLLTISKEISKTTPADHPQFHNFLT